MGITNDLLPEVARPDSAKYLAAPAQIEIGIGQYRLHKFMGYQNAYIRVLHLGAVAVALDRNEILNIRMIDSQRQHQSTAATSLGHGISALRQQIHKGGATG